MRIAGGVAANSNPSYRRKMKLSVSREQLKAYAVILFFSEPFIRWILEFVFSRYAGYIAILLPFVPLFLVVLSQQGRLRVPDFFVLLMLIGIFFLLTYIIHPNYAFWYKRDYYGVWDYVLRPDNGIYAYLFLRLLDEPKRILNCLRVSAFLCFIYYAVVLYNATQVGYWLTSFNGEIRHLSYSLEFGYNMLLYVLVFLYCALRYKKMTDWIMALVGFFMIMGAGSRGPVLDIMIFLVLYVLTNIQESRNKVRITFIVCFLGITLYFLYIPLLNLVSTIFDQMGMSSRFIRLLMEGSLSNDNGRLNIWKRAIQMIRDNPFGYGAMGSRHVIYNIIQVGHPHNIFLEFLIDYGVFLGSGLIIGGFVGLVKLLRKPDIGEWKGLVLIFIGATSQLLLSGTYWHRQGVWALLALAVSINKMRKKGIVS